MSKRTKKIKKIRFRFPAVYSTIQIGLALTAACLSFKSWPAEATFQITPLDSPNNIELPHPINLNVIKYNDKEFQLAYNVFIMSGNVGYAYAIAKAAVQHNPANYTWRERLAQAALWSGNAYGALEQWLYFIKHDYQADSYLDKSYILAGQLNAYDSQAFILRRQIHKTPQDRGLWLKYIMIMQDQGLPKQAISVLKTIPYSEKDKNFLNQYIAIYKGLDEPDNELHYLSLLFQIDKNGQFKTGERIAEILYSRGDINGAFKLYQQLKQILSEKNKMFWNTYFNLALYAGNKPAMIEAYEALLKQDAIQKAQMIQLIFLHLSNKANLRAYAQAKFAYHKYHYEELIKTIVSLADTLSRWQELKNFINIIPAKALIKLKSEPSYAVILANLEMHLGNRAAAYQAWLTLLKRWPNRTIVQENYLWFLLADNNDTQLEFLIKRWCLLFLQKPKLALPYLAALVELGHYKQALIVALKQRNNQSFEYLGTLYDLLIQNDRNYDAYYLGQKTFYKLHRQALRQKGKLNLAQQLKFTEFAQAYAPNSLTYHLLLTMQDKMFKNPEVDNQIISFALNTNRYDLANYIVNVHRLKKTYIPPWMTLTLALIYNDRPTMLYLLEHKGPRLPYRDRVTAATLTGNAKLAQAYAYQGLKEHPYDQEMYKLFQDTMLPDSNRFAIGGYEKGLGSATGPQNITSMRFFIKPSLSMTLYDNLWWPKIQDPQQLAWTPSIDRTFGLRLRQQIRRGWVQALIAQRKSLNNVLMLNFKWQYKFSARTNFAAELGYHDRTNDSTALYLAGMKNELMLTANTALDSYNSFNAQLKLDRFYGQQSTYLGSGQVLRGHWQYKFHLTYPDWNINLYGTIAHFKSQNITLPPALQRLIPSPTVQPTTTDQDEPTAPDTQSTVATNVNFYMPISYKEIGLTLGLGQQYKNSYTHDWKPFFEAGYLYSGAFGLGQLAQGGIATSVFGRDHFIMFGEFNKNQQQAQINYLVGIRYALYF